MGGSKGIRAQWKLYGGDRGGHRRVHGQEQAALTSEPISVGLVLGPFLLSSSMFPHPFETPFLLSSYTPSTQLQRWTFPGLNIRSKRHGGYGVAC